MRKDGFWHRDSTQVKELITAQAKIVPFKPALRRAKSGVNWNDSNQVKELISHTPEDTRPFHRRSRSQEIHRSSLVEFFHNPPAAGYHIAKHGAWAQTFNIFAQDPTVRTEII